jgi:peptide/nickel transport system permease protein
MRAVEALSRATPRERAPQFVRRLAARPLAVISLAFLVLVVVASVAAPLLAPYDPTATDMLHVLSRPTSQHLLGTDTLGRDVLSRVLYGGRVTLLGAVVAVTVFLIVGIPLGIVAGYAGGWFDRFITRLADVALAVPAIIILLVVLSIFGGNETAAMVTLGCLGAPALMRVIRGATLAVRQDLYVAAARIAGLSHPQILRRHILPRVTGPVIVQASLFAASALLVETGLGYLGLGVQPPTPSWGGMVAEASTQIEQQAWLLVPSGVTIGLTILALGLLGDAVRDATSERWTSTTAPGRTVSGEQAQLIPDARPGTAPNPVALLSVRNLSIAFPAPHGLTPVTLDVGFDIYPGETVGIVGESGSGKTATALALLGLLPAGGQIRTGQIVFAGEDLVTLPPRALRKKRGKEIAFISQEPIVSLDPAFTVESQIAELVRQHDHVSRAAARARSVELLRLVNLPSPERVAKRYPHELSGGMAQRVAIAMALAGRPKLLIADEPTTALDVTVQAEILDLLRCLQRDTGMAILLVTHDWGVVADLCHRAVVMYAGQVVEYAPVRTLFRRYLHPYTEGLLHSDPHAAVPGKVLPSIPGSVPSPQDWPQGCHFRPRCPYATPECAAAPIAVYEPEAGHSTRCLHHEVLQQEQSLVGGRQ